jgi:cobyrinic acid a,c-diamide synthase
MSTFPRLLISAAHKSSGKTTLSIGLCAALRNLGLAVQPFKKGPDYIDPLWLGEAAGRPCHNLDFQTQRNEEIRRAVQDEAEDADISLIEGNKGLYDGMDLTGGNSNAALAHLLDAPVLLVLDTRGMTRGVAPLVLGYRHFDPELKIAGVILNQVGGSRHEGKLRAVLEHYTAVPVLGAVYRDPGLEIVERHLGLMPSNENQQTRAKIQAIAGAVAAQVDLSRLLEIARAAPPPHQDQAPPRLCSGHDSTVRIGVIRDAAFGFYYPGDLRALAEGGAQLVWLDALRDSRLPALDGLFIGGGFPETQMEELAANAAFRAEVRQAVENGLPVYAECGGLMYLARSLRWGERLAEMAGALPLDTVMYSQPQGRGYVQLQETGSLWPEKLETPFYAHEFHYSRAENLPPGSRFAYRVLRGYGLDGQHDGLIYRNTLASYSHLRDVAGNRWTRRFLAFVREKSARHEHA